MKLNQTSIIAIGIWAALLAAHFFGVLFFFNEPVIPILVDSIIYFSLFGLLSIGCFYFIKYLNLPEKPAFSTILNLLAAVIACTFIWFLLGKLILSNLFSGNESFMEFFDSFYFLRGFEGIVLFILMVTLFVVIRYQERIGAVQLEEAKLKSLVSESRMEALNSQINPHFLFNSLNSISAQTLVDAEKAREMLSGLSEYLRYTLESQDQALVPFEKEIQNALKYMDIEGIRFGKRLDFKYEIGNGAGEYLVPRMLLQPLLENIIKHAVENSTGTIRAELKVSSEAQGFTLLLENDLGDHVKGSKSSGIGLRNIEERLQICFGQDFGFHADELDGKFKVFLKIRKQE